MRRVFTRTLDAVAGTWSQAETLDSSTRFWNINAAQGTLTLELTSADGAVYQMDRVAGHNGEEKSIVSFRVKSDVASDVVTLTFSETREFNTPGALGSGSVLSVRDTLADNFDGGYATVAAGSTASLGNFTYATNRRIIVSLQPGAVGPVRIQGDTNTGNPGAGVWLYPDSAPFVFKVAKRSSATQGTLYAFNPAALDVTVCVGVEYD